jgi:hypothetical protein
VNAIFHTITALIGSVVAVLRSFVDAILGVFQGFFHLIGSTLSGLVHTFEGLSKFVLSKSKPAQSLRGSEKFGNLTNVRCNRQHSRGRGTFDWCFPLFRVSKTQRQAGDSSSSEEDFLSCGTRVSCKPRIVDREGQEIHIGQEAAYVIEFWD